MTATPFSASLTLTNIHNGEVQSETITFSDVANAYGTFDSTSNNFCTVMGDCEITDIVLTAAGVDTSKLRMFVNGRDTGYTKIGAGLIVSVNNRVPDNPIIKGGASLQFKQLA